MTRPLQATNATGLWSALLGVFASGSTLVCCALPALLVALGAGAALSGLVAAFPQLVWLSAHKLPLFGVAGALLLVNGVWQWRSRRDPCPLDAQARQSCLRTRRAAWRLYLLSLLIFLIGGGFAFLPTLLG